MPEQDDEPGLVPEPSEPEPIDLGDVDDPDFNKPLPQPGDGSRWGDPDPPGTGSKNETWQEGQPAPDPPAAPERDDEPGLVPEQDDEPGLVPEPSEPEPIDLGDVDDPDFNKPLPQPGDGSRWGDPDPPGTGSKNETWQEGQPAAATPPGANTPDVPSAPQAPLAPDPRHPETPRMPEPRHPETPRMPEPRHPETPRMPEPTRPSLGGPRRAAPSAPEKGVVNRNDAPSSRRPNDRPSLNHSQPVAEPKTSGKKPQSVRSGLSAAEQRAGRTDAEIIKRLEQATGKQGLAALKLEAGLGPQDTKIGPPRLDQTSPGIVDAITLEAPFIERGILPPLHVGTAAGKRKLDALEAGLAEHNPLAENTARSIARRIDLRQDKVGPGGSFEYNYNEGELAKIGDALDLTPRERQRLADIVRQLYPKDRPTTMDDSGRLGSAQQLAAQESRDKLEVVLNSGSSIGSIVAGFVGMAGGSAKDMAAAAQMVHLLEAGAAQTGSASDAAKAGVQPSRGGVIGSVGKTPMSVVGKPSTAEPVKPRGADNQKQATPAAGTTSDPSQGDAETKSLGKVDDPNVKVPVIGGGANTNDLGKVDDPNVKVPVIGGGANTNDLPGNVSRIEPQPQPHQEVQLDLEGTHDAPPSATRPDRITASGNRGKAPSPPNPARRPPSPSQRDATPPPPNPRPPLPPTPANSPLTGSRRMESRATYIHDRYAEAVIGGPVNKKVFAFYERSAGERGRVLGSREADHWDNSTGTLYEFNSGPWSEMTQSDLKNLMNRKLDQVGKDIDLRAGGAVDGTEVRAVVWYGVEPLPTTGEGRKLREALVNAGIDYVVVPLPANLRHLHPPVR
ncbi:hypothetical protein [Rhodococcus opacus]|uniref:hypothetical protein n=2 Tax=Rhodococcus opacus TaxID=37919 RepID=UPI001D0200C2|nr:hypothetical protein [Rhodococcus opacus]UDH01620.1 hypothetical protein K2Z90_008195 [Rhodococcus opacus PD630]